MKKLFALILALLLAFGMTGCSVDDAIEVIEVIDAIADMEDSLDSYEDAVEDGSDTVNSYEEIDPPYTDDLFEPDAPEVSDAPIDEDGWYYSADDVSLYLYTYGELPDNFITKDEAEDLGWTGGSVEQYAPGYAIGGDYFGNYEGLLPEEDGRTYYECDIDTDGYHSRGSRRIVFSNDGLIYYSDDHYESFVLLYGEE